MRKNQEVSTMKKTGLLWLASSAAIMLVLPWCAVTFVKGDGAMAVCFLLFFAVDPLYAILTGVFSGKNTAGRWWLPLLAAGSFLAGAWLLFDPGETAFLLYAVFYLLLGLAAMAVTHLLGR